MIKLKMSDNERILFDLIFIYRKKLLSLISYMDTKMSFRN